jgi:hypothetical protein
VITTTSLANATRGHAYLQLVKAVGGTTPYVFKLASGKFPAGVTLATSGKISGTPKLSDPKGVYQVNIQAKDHSTPVQTTPIAKLTITLS